MSIRINGTNTAANPGITGTDTDTGLQFGTDEVNIVTGGSTRSTVDSSGRLLVGTTSTVANATLVLQGQSAGSTEHSRLWVCKGESLPSSGSVLGEVVFGDSNQGAYAQIASIVDAAPSSGDLPGRLTFSTTADGASSPTEQMRLTSTGDLRFNSGYGSVATAYGVRSWIHFNGGASTIGTGDASGNVSSVTDNGTGDYTISFTNSMPDGNYVIFGTATWTTTWGANIFAFRDATNGYPGTGAFRIYVSATNNYSAIDAIDIMVGVVR